MVVLVGYSVFLALILAFAGVASYDLARIARGKPSPRWVGFAFEGLAIVIFAWGVVLLCLPLFL